MQTVCSKHSREANCTEDHNAKSNAANNPKNNPKNNELTRLTREMGYGQFILRKNHDMFVKKEFQSHPEILTKILAEYEKRKAQSGTAEDKPITPIGGVTRAMIIAATKAANALLEKFGIVRNKSRRTREKPVAGTPRASRSVSERTGETSRYWFNKAIVDQAGNCIFCDHKFGTEVRDLEYGTTQVLTPQEEHLLPRDAGGKTVDGNIHAACGICNSTKSDYIFDGPTDPRLADVIEREWKKYEIVDSKDHVCQCGVCGKRVA